MSCGDDNIEDPYGGSAEVYANVFEICERACKGFLDSIYHDHAE